MKNLIALVIASYAFAFAIIPDPVGAQTITLNSISATQFCAGEEITANFTVTGGFKRKNAFTLQLSDASGSFQSGFRNLGSIFDSLPGAYSIRVTIPRDVQSSASYRFRILAAIPFMTSADNGANVSIGTKPWIGGYRTSTKQIVVGEPITFALDDDSLSSEGTYIWDFGAEALPPVVVGTTARDVVFPTGGPKTVTITATSPTGCTNSWTTTVNVLSCSPRIPNDATVIKDDNVNQGNGSSIYWVNPGVTFSTGGSATVFAEPGSTVAVQGSSIVYLKRGASCISAGGGSIIFYEDGASLPNGFSNAKQCTSLDFDYTAAPPNIFKPLSVTYEVAQAMAVFPNPSKGSFTISGMPADVSEVAVFDVLGNRIAKLESPGATSFQVDLSSVTPGSYYVRIATQGSVVTKRVVIQR